MFQEVRNRNDSLWSAGQERGAVHAELRRSVLGCESSCCQELGANEDDVGGDQDKGV